MLITRVTKIGLCLCLGLFGLLVAYDNVVDYGANYGAIGHVLSMDTTFTRDVLRDRAITNPHLWRLAYAAIIAAEALTGILLLIGAGRMSVALRASADTFQRAKAFAIAGCGLGLLTWLFGFMIIAGEWFAMWQSQRWNEQQPSFRLYATLLLVLIFLVMRDDEPASDQA